MVEAKSRLVVRGFKLREEVDFSEMFAPTVSSSCVRLLSLIACECDLDICHFDVCVCVCVCVFIKLHITTQSGPVILVILCHSH